MTSSFSNNKAARLKESRGLRAKAPIAAQFEDCVQAFQQLSDSLQVKLSRSSLKNISRECNARLSLWANESGASSRLLDYALRESPTLKRQTLQLLEDLFATLKDVIAEVLLQDAGEAVGDSEDSIDNVRDEATVEKFEPSSFLDDPIFSLEPVDAEVGVEAEAEALLSEAEDIVAALSQLMPALRDPFERHEDEKTSSAKSPTNDASKELYTEIAQVLFPDASEALADQFGALNVQRLRGISCIRDVGKKSRAHRQSNARQASKGLNSLIGLSGQSEFAQQTSWPVLQESARAESDGGTSTIRSHADLLSKSPSLGQTTATSVSGDAGELAILQYLVPPSVPVDLSKEEQFECPYCQSNLPLTFSTEPMVDQDWIEHVYHDLKPYVCTFDGCVHQQRPTGDRHQWFLHELSHHRLQPVWTCGMCRESFECARGFDSHLETSHPSLSDDSWRFLGVNCKGYCHEKPPLLRCNLCPKIADDLADLERHVGRHLEAFALTALFRNDLPDEGPLSKTGLLDEYFQGLGDLQHIAPDMAKSRDEDHSDASTINASNATDVDEAVDSADVPSPFALASNPATDGSEKVLEFLDRQKPQEPTMSVRTGIPDRYDNFVGRIEDLEAMYGHLSAPGRVCTISGRGGIGKTALGVEYVHKYGPEYPHVFWVESDNPGIGAEKYGNIATTLKLAEKPLTTEDTRTFLVREYLTTSETRWLLIFDNVASWKDVSRYIPRTLAKTKGSILITTRTGPLLPIGPAHPIYHRQHAVELNVWPLQHAREFLLTSISPKMGKEAVQSHEESDLATQVVEVVGRLPLAVSMIVGYIKVSRCTLSDFLEMWAEKEHNTKKKRKRRMDIDSSDIDSTIDSLWTIGIREVRMNSRRLLDVLSFLDSDTIHKHLLVGDHKEEYLEFLNSSETISYKRMIHELSGRRLVTVKQLPNSGEAYSIHRLLQQKVLLDMEDLGFVDAYRKAFRLIRKKFPRANPQQVPTPSSWPICSDYMRHVFTLHRVHCQNAPSAPMMDMDPADIAKLFYDAGFYIWSSQTNSYDGLSFLKTAAKILEDSGHDENSRIRADILCVHGLQLLNMGCVERAQGPKLLERALKIRKRLYEENRASRDDDVLHQNAANDYALCLLNEHEFDRAGEIIRSCRERYLYWGTEDSNPWENSKYYGNYSIVLMWKGELDMAITYQEKSLQLMEQSVAGRSTQYYRRAYMLGCYLLQKEDLEGALEKHLEVLTARLEMQGKHHAHTMMSMYAVGAMYHHLGKPNMAIQYLQQCLETVNSSWWDRAAIGRAQYHLAILYREQDFDEEAAAELEGRADAFLEEFQEYIPEAVRDSGDKLMIFDDLQPTFLGRYTGVKLLKHLQEQHRAKLAESSN